MAETRCGTCRWWNARLNSRGARIVAHDPHYTCMAPIPDLPTLPASIQVGDRYGQVSWPPKRGYMGKSQGAGCTFWEDWKSARQSAANTEEISNG